MDLQVLSVRHNSLEDIPVEIGACHSLRDVDLYDRLITCTVLYAVYCVIVPVLLCLQF